ncbi:MAG: AAA family ATPase [Verrucomicrobiaceae bacterium]|nr:AAA family ATPase [Verrucomicrobiaceae bacterium]
MSDTKDDPPKPGTPEEITRKLEDFIKNSLGGQVLFTRVEGPGGSPTETPEDREEEPPSPEVDLSPIFEFRLKPAEIKEHLDKYVIRQDEAKKVLATAVCDHYNHARIIRAHRDRGENVEFSKQNVIILGPTGVGKTYLVKHIAELIGVPFVKADATKFSETGYVGGDVDDLVRDLVAKAGGSIELAEHGIIYLDEVDKLATPSGRLSRDVSGRGVQTALLKLMEETEVPLYAPNDMRAQMQMMFDTRKGALGGKAVINTRNILFIVSGAFAGLEKVVENRVSKGSIGFSAQSKERPSGEGLMRQAETQDLIDYGFEAEFIGRLPVRVVCDSLIADDLYEIMKRSAGSIIRQFEKEFGAYGIEARFSDEAMKVIAERAAQEKTGARGLVTAWERVLRDFKFELPSLGLPVLEVSGQLVNEPSVVLELCREAARSLSNDPRTHQARDFCERFKAENDLDLKFEPDAIHALLERCEQEGATVHDLCARLFKDFPFGLQLVVRNTGSRVFSLNRDAITAPDAYLSDLVAKSYRDPSEGGARS